MYLYEFITCLARIIQIVQGTEDHIAVYGPVCHPQYIIWTEAKLRNRPVSPNYYMDRSEAKLRSIYYFGGDRPVHKLPFDDPHIYNKSRSEWHISTQADDPIQPISTQPIFSHHLNVNTTKINILKHVVFFYVSLVCYLLTYIDMGFPGW